MDNRETTTYEKDWHPFTARITINNLTEYNSYYLSTLREMCKYIEEAMWDDSVQFIVLTGAGDKAFCTGGNVKEYANIYNKKPSDFWKWGEIYGRVFHLIRHCGKIVIARVNGITAGGGFEFVCASDLAVASENATFISPGPRVGMTSIGGLSQFLPLHTSIKKAAEIVMLSKEISAKEALELGIINAVVSYSELDKTVKNYIDKMSNLSPASLHYYKVQLNFWRDIVWDMTWEHAKEWFSKQIGSIEPSEGLHAFKEKRNRDYISIRRMISEGIDTNYPYGSYLVTCKSCGAKFLPEKSVFCLSCGAKI